VYVLFIAIRDHIFCIKDLFLSYCIISQILFFMHNTTSKCQIENHTLLKRNWRLLQELSMHPWTFIYWSIYLLPSSEKHALFLAGEYHQSIIIILITDWKTVSPHAHTHVHTCTHTQQTNKLILMFLFVPFQPFCW